MHTKCDGTTKDRKLLNTISIIVVVCVGGEISRGMDRLPVLLQSLQINMPRVVPQHKHTTSYQYVCIDISTNGWQYR